ncbi:hydrogenase [Streptomyces umbrinus]|uniref:aromatic ring-hydroxylating oxygenase subunit alpha n=1 Tax=Streptomyces umbrinus TaxID=67370 RepID=UPI0016762DBF|nr:Rieske 2Fe-2S domain-containing protein [Streptomyces umbrinus]GHB59107.1 hydrogenase [Streptomyces umbrinus]
MTETEDESVNSAEQNAPVGGYGSPNGSMRGFLSEVQADLAQGMLSPRVLNDPELHQAELERIFATCWVFVGHVSEIPSPGDYVLRYVGEDQFILVRDEQGEIQLLLNSCMHRGTMVCRAEKGNTSHFRCPYHGWIYKNSGDWNGAPHRGKAYRKLDAASWGLRRAPHVDSYQGLIFACLDPDAISLREYLGDMCWYLDVLFGLNEQGMSVAGDPHRWVVPANWKSGADNFVGDAYHVQSLHQSLGEIGLVPGIEKGAGAHFHISLKGGHGLIANSGILPEPFGVMGYPPEVASTFDLDRFEADQRAFLEGRFGVTGFTIFPNLSFFRSVTSTEVGQPPMNFTLLRQWQPRGPAKFDLWNWSLVWNSAPKEYNQAAYNAGINAFGPSGVFEQDDTVAWSGGPSTGRSVFARQSMKFNYQMGLEGMSDYALASDWMGPGDASTTYYGDMNQRRWWHRWSEQLQSS